MSECNVRIDNGFYLFYNKPSFVQLNTAMRMRIDKGWFVFTTAALAAGSLFAQAQEAAKPADAAQPADAAAAAKAEEAKKPKWETSAGFGATVTSGNSETMLFTANVQALRKWERNEVSLGADGAYGENKGEKEVESIHGFGQYNRLFTEKFYGYVRLDALHDSIADIEYRVTVGPGAGYYFIKNEKTRLSGEVGPSAVLERQGDKDAQYLALRLSERWEQKLSDRARLWQSVEFLPQVDKTENFILNSEIGVEADITKKLSLQSYIQDSYDNQPAPGRKDNDIKLVTGIKYKF